MIPGVCEICVGLGTETLPCDCREALRDSDGNRDGRDGETRLGAKHDSADPQDIAQ